MDDDLMSLRGGGSSPSGGGSIPDDNPLGLGLDDFVPAPIAPDAPLAPSAPIGKSAAPAAKAKPASKPKAKTKARSASGGGFLGMTPQQSMLLSIFLFLDVAVLGCLILIALGAIKLT
jgi:hypothetical protein